MRKNILMKSKRMAAFALSLSVILNGGSAAGAAELTVNPNTDSAAVSETEIPAEEDIPYDTEQTAESEDLNEKETETADLEE